MAHPFCLGPIHDTDGPCRKQLFRYTFLKAWKPQKFCVACFVERGFITSRERRSDLHGRRLVATIVRCCQYRYKL